MNDISSKDQDIPMLQDQEKIQAIIGIKGLSPENINLNDPSLSVSYGSDTMNDIAKFSDGLLGQVRAKDAGEVGESLTNLLMQVKGFDFKKVGKKSFLESIPFIGTLFNKTQKALAEFKTLSDQISLITSKLEEAGTGLLKDVYILEQLFDYNKKFHYELSAYIEAGKKRLDYAKNIELPQLKSDADSSSDSMKAQAVRDFADNIDRFERRVNELQISRTLTLQTAPQIRLIQNNDKALAEKIQSSVLTTIPLWKGQMVLALSIQGQKNAAKLQKDVSDTTNNLLRKNAEMLQSASIDTAREVERSIVDIETVREVQSKLISTIESTLQIAQEGRERRSSIEKELGNLEKNLKEKLSTLSTTSKNNVISSAMGK